MKMLKTISKFGDLMCIIGMTYLFIEMILLKHTETYRISFTIIFLLYLLVIVAKYIAKNKADEGI